MEPVDQLKALQADARVNLAKNRRNISGLAEARDLQRADRRELERAAKKEAERLAQEFVRHLPQRDNRRKWPRNLTPELLAAIKAAEGTQKVIAAQFGISVNTVLFARKGYYD